MTEFGRRKKNRKIWPRRVLTAFLSVCLILSCLPDVGAFAEGEEPGEEVGAAAGMESGTETKTEAKTESGAETKPEAETESEAETKPEAGTKPESETTTEAETRPGTEPEAADAEPGTDSSDADRLTAGDEPEKGISSRAVDKEIVDWKWADADAAKNELLGWNDAAKQWEATVHMNVKIPISQVKEILNGTDGLLPSQIEVTLADGTKEIVAIDWGALLAAISGADTTTGWSWRIPGTVLPPGYSCSSQIGMQVEIKLVGPTKFLNNWKFEARDGTEIKENDDRSQWMAVYPLSLKSADVIDALKKVLPEKIYGEGFVKEQQGKGGFQLKGDLEKPIDQVANSCGYLPVDWLLDRIDGMDFQEGQTYILRASYNPYWGVNGGVNGEGGLLNTYLELPVTLHVLDLDEHIETEKVSDPEATTVNLFDYWVEDYGEYPQVLHELPDGRTAEGDILQKSDKHQRAGTAPDSSPVHFSTFTDWNKGINAGHLLIFGDGLIHAGLWNKGAGEVTPYGKAYAGMEGIVKPVLEADGYPAIDTKYAKRQMVDTVAGEPVSRDYTTIQDHMLAGECTGDSSYNGTEIQNLSNTVLRSWGKTIGTDEESLDYLFDPKENHPNKKTYRNVTGLFQLDDDGYYYYNMRDNFAEFVNDPDGGSDGYFRLYDAGATTRTDGDKSIGNFFPFNTGEEVFTGVDDQGKLTSAVGCARNSMNHHLGMTVEIDFRQPVDGRISAGTKGSKPMTFGFSGDDDVWVYIDDVLVLDLGGVHSEIYGTIDFSTGDVYIGRAFNSKGIPSNPKEDPDNVVTYTTLQELYRAAGKEGDIDWKDGVPTFASNSDHKLKMFYLERGNYDSSIALRFNLQPRLYQQIKKVDQDGNPIEGVEFALYEAKEDNGTYQAVGDELARLKTGADGMAQFTETDREGKIRPFNFSDRVAKNTQTYILKEVVAPSGYRSLPEDIVFRYDPNTTHLLVINRWTTGAYANFVELIEGNSEISYGSFDQDGNINPSSYLVEDAVQKDGLVVAIPMMYQKGAKKWQALYGSNTEGLHTVTPESMEVEAWRKAALTAVVYQCADGRENAPHWYLEWNEDKNRLEGTLNDLPGRTDRYLVNDSSGDMRTVYAVIFPEVFEAFHISGEDSKSRYEALGAFINQELADGKTVAEVVDEIYAVSSTVGPSTVGHGLSFLNVDQFIRNVRSVIFIPNERRELRVWKVEQDGRGVNGVEFGLYGNPACTGDPLARGETAAVDGQDGVLIFSPSANEAPGHAAMAWGPVNTRYYLKEISAPSGYRLNGTVVPVVVGSYSIYADAGDQNDGISVMAGVGKLAETLTYVADEEVDITLRDITATGQVQAREGFTLNGWHDMLLEGTDIPRTMNLHYGMNAASGYGLHDEDGGKTIRPFLITDSGFIRVRVQQNSRALTDESSGADTSREELGSTDITSLFSLLNIVVVTDRTVEDTGTGQLTVKKTVRGDGLSEADYTRMFSFVVTFQDADGRPLSGQYHFYGTDKSGYIESGGTLPLHHDESITILGLPEGTKYQVREVPVAGWNSIPTGGTASGNILADSRATAAFVNTNVAPDTGELRIQKTVTGAGDRNQSFTFEVRFLGGDGQELTESYPYMGSAVGTIRSGEQISLKHNENIVVTELPPGTYYVVTEAEANQGGYQTRSTDESGTILSGWESAAKFVNDKEEDPGTSSEPGEDPDTPEDGKTGQLTIRKTVRGDGLSETDYVRMFSFVVTLRDADGRPLSGRYQFYGTDKTGYMKSGDTVSLHHDESITILGLPEGTKYQVREVSVAGWNSIPTSGIASGNIVADGMATAAFVNTNETVELGDLRIQKTVTGAGDRGRSFTFRVRFLGEDGKELTESYPYMGSAAGSVRSGGQIKLKHNEDIVVTGLPAGTRYEVTEAEADQDGYQTSSTDGSGTILSGRESAAKFVNDKEEEPGTSPDPGKDPDKNVDGAGDGPAGGTPGPDGSGATSAGGSPRSMRPTAAGDRSRPAVWWFTLCASLAVLAAVCAVCRRQEGRRRKRRSR